MSRSLSVLTVLVVCLGSLASFGSLAHGQLPRTRLDSIFPPGGKVGSEVDLEIQGGDLDEVATLHFSHPGITAKQEMTESDEVRKQPRPLAGKFRVNIADNVPVGIYEVRAVGRYGISNPRAFAVGTLDEVLKEGQSGSPEEALPFELGATVNGRCVRDRVDYYRLHLEKGQNVLLECFAERIDSRMDPTFVLYGPRGGELFRVRDVVGHDCVLDYTAPDAGDYTLGVYDFLYGGDNTYFYRLSATTGPFIDAVFPPVVEPGKTQSVTLYGRNLPGGKAVVGPLGGGQLGIGRPLEQAQAKISLPDDKAPDRASTAFVEPHTAQLNGRLLRVDLPGGKSNPVTVYAATAPMTVEQEPLNDETPESVGVPCEYVGQFYPAGDVDWITFEAQAGQVYWIEVFAHRLGMDSDPRLTVQQVTPIENAKEGEPQEQVKDIALVDDPQLSGNTAVSMFDVRSYDPSYRLEVKEDGVYRLKLEDLYGSNRSDPRCMYRLSIHRQEPDFDLVAFARPTKLKNDTYPKATVLRRGGRAVMPLRVFRQSGFRGEIEVSVEGLPAGVTCQGATIGGDVKRGWLVFEAADDAKQWAGSIRIVGKADIDGKPVTRQARGGALLWRVTRNDVPISRMTRDIGLAVVDAEQAPLAIIAGDGKPIETSPGATVKVPFKIVKHGKVKGNVTVTPVALHQDIAGKAGTAKGDAGEVSFELRTDRIPTGTYTFYLQGAAKVTYERNQDAVKAAQARQKTVQQTLTELTAAAKQAATARDAAAAKDATAQKELAQAETALAQAKQKSDEAAKALAQAEAKLAQAQKSGDDDSDAVKQARQQVDSAKKQKQDAAKAQADAEAAAKQAKTTGDASAKAKAEAEKAAADAEAFRKRAEDYKKQVDAELKTVTDGNKPRDIDVAVVSSPVRLKIFEHPVRAKLESGKTVKQGEKLELPLTVERIQGFDDAIDVRVTLPGGVRGISVKADDVPKGMPQGKLELTCAADATPGKHTAEVQLVVRLGRVTHTVKVPLEFEVQEVKKEK